MARFLLAAFEVWAVNRLLRSPLFHQGVRAAHKRIHEIRHGPAAEDMGGTTLDSPKRDSFMKHFIDEVKDGLGVKKSDKR